MEAICRIRAQLGIVVIVWVGSHIGVSPNAMADAAAKAHLSSTRREPVTERLAEWVLTKPYLSERRAAGGWELSDRRAYAEHRARAMDYVRGRLGEGLVPGQTMAGQGARTWAQLARMPLRMAPVLDEEGAAAKPTWEDVRTHNESVGLMVQLRAGDVLQLPHEASWRHRRRAEKDTQGPATRDGAQGCPACSRAHKARGGEVTAARRELCDVQHALTGECAAAHMPARRAQDDGVAKLQSMAAKEVRRVAMQGKETQRDSMRSITQVLQGARRATQRGVHGVGHTITAADFACLRQLLASALPEHEPCGEGGGGGAAFTAAKVDTVLRNMRHHAKEQVHRIASAAQPEVHRRKQAEEARGWLTVVLRAWQEAAQDAHAHAARAL